MWGANIIGKTYLDVANKYAQYVLDKFGNNCVVVFDGYSYSLSTKNPERLCRLEKLRCSDVEVKENNNVNICQEKFLSNGSNKESLIKLISTIFTN